MALTPYYDHDGITIYCGDAVEVVTSLGPDVCDCIICDPPFSSGTRQDAGKAMRGAMVRGRKWGDNWFSRDNLATVGFVYLMRLSATAMFNAANANAAAHVFIDWRMFPHLYGAMESAGWVAKNLVVWDKSHYGMGAGYRNQHELILYTEKGSVDFQDHRTPNVLQCRRTPGHHHPTEKPSILCERLILATTKKGDLILDPFCGSGSILCAAKHTGRRAIGVEIEERYCEIAAERLRQGVLF